MTIGVTDPSVTEILGRLCRGEREAESELLARVYDELHQIARARMSGERQGHTLQTTALVSEAWMRIFQGAEIPWSDRGHFLRVAARAMRNVLIDNARARQAAKRGKRADLEPEELELLFEAHEDRTGGLLEVHDALKKLAAYDDKLAELVELRFFAGLSIADTASALGVSTATVERGWRVARAWLRAKLAE